MSQAIILNDNGARILRRLVDAEIVPLKIMEARYGALRMSEPPAEAPDGVFTDFEALYARTRIELDAMLELRAALDGPVLDSVAA